MNSAVAFFWWWKLQSSWGAAVIGNNLSRPGGSLKTIMVWLSYPWHCLSTTRTWCLVDKEERLTFIEFCFWLCRCRVLHLGNFLSVGVLCMMVCHDTLLDPSWGVTISTLKYILFVWYWISIPGFELQYWERSSPQNVRYNKLLLATYN